MDAQALRTLCWMAGNSCGGEHPLACLRCVSSSRPSASSLLEVYAGLLTQHWLSLEFLPRCALSHDAGAFLRDQRALLHTAWLQTPTPPALRRWNDSFFFLHHQQPVQLTWLCLLRGRWEDSPKGKEKLSSEAKFTVWLREKVSNSATLIFTVLSQNAFNYNYFWH